MLQSTGDVIWLLSLEVAALVVCWVVAWHDPARVRSRMLVCPLDHSQARLTVAGEDVLSCSRLSRARGCDRSCLRPD
jgi:hypothetical protein